MALVVVLDLYQEHLFNLKFAAKGLERNAKKCDKDEREEKVKLKRVCFIEMLTVSLNTVISTNHSRSFVVQFKRCFMCVKPHAIEGY